MELTRQFPAETFARLADWDFLDLSGKSPIFTSPFGDIFFQAGDGVWMLDLLDGSLKRVWADLDECRVALQTEEAQDDCLTAGLALSAERAGFVPTAYEVYDYAIAPILGGPISVANIEVRDFGLKLSIMGQIFAQVRNASPAARVAELTVDGKRPQDSRKRRGLFRR
jgi:hypothetical protein